MNIYIGNLPSTVSDEDLRAAFQTYGEITSATVIKDKWSGESKGFGFVEMPKNEEAQAAITAMNGKDFKGKTVTVNEARPRTERRPGGGGRGRGGFGGGGGGGRRQGGGGRRF